MDRKAVVQVEQELNGLKFYESDDQLIIGLDFGTTFSGMAYTFTNSHNVDLVTILDWPGLEGFKQPKVPTIISYDTNDKRVFTWGAQRHSSPPIEGLKLLLDPTQETPLYLPETNASAKLKKLGKPAVEVATDYISSIYKHVLGKIETKVPADYMQMCQKKFVVSVPAIWSDKAKNTTLMAAKQAGIHPVTLIKEPEAAALYTLHVLKEKSLAVGDAFVICDAGGGTVDLISYEITQLHSKLELKELVPGKAGMAGSLGLNKRFAQAVKDLVGEDQYFHLRKKKGFEEAMKQFDKNVKTAFRGDSSEDYFMNFPMADLQDDPDNRLVANCWNMKGDDVKRIFQPLITDIQRLVEDQVNRVKVKRLSESHAKANEIKAIFLVGGFGSSEYLKQCLQTAHTDIQVIQPHDAWSAIVKGAVLSQLPQQAVITSTVATKHYGVCALSEYNEYEHGSQARVRDRYTGKARVNKARALSPSPFVLWFPPPIPAENQSMRPWNTLMQESPQMEWYIHRGEDMQRDQRIVFSFYRSLPADFSPSQLMFKDELLECALDVAVPYPREGVTAANCTLTSDLSGVDSGLFKKKTSVDGKDYVDVFYNLVVTMESAIMKFSLEVDGKEMGSVQARYE